MDIILLHSAQVETSRAIVEELGLDAGTVDSTVTKDGHSVRVVGKHALAVGVCPNFSAYPAVVVKNGEAVWVKSPVESWADCLAFLSAPAQPLSPGVPAVRPALSKLEFLRLFTDEELVRLKMLEGSDPVVAVFWEQYRAAESLRPDDERTGRAIEYLASKGYITPERKSAILAG